MFNQVWWETAARAWTARAARRADGWKPRSAREIDECVRRARHGELTRPPGWERWDRVR
ncbi:hypothetical protein [Allobranchiibius huperziae]|uniref:Uncharacterized protein n=1 Tax=Allobranchiibius huperziae TaxID=1874116 RepID=A0A853DFH2_9MICO|nr:hypothetical protein [Allobranchiibius huperziae]NYJ76296.1 hypothetical protein [Allobranchiibius huperziae]